MSPLIIVYSCISFFFVRTLDCFHPLLKVVLSAPMYTIFQDMWADERLSSWYKKVLVRVPWGHLLC